MKIEITPLEGLLLISPKVFADERGWFLESYNQDQFLSRGISTVFVQDNHSRSCKNTLRGLHFQTHPGQAKLVRCTIGEVWDVAVDIRPNSQTFGKWFGAVLSEHLRNMVYIPIGFAHGYCVLSEYAEFQYKCSNVYNGTTEAGIAWDDPDLAVQWPVQEPLLSNRDRNNPTLREYQRSVGQ